MADEELLKSVRIVQPVDGKEGSGDGVRLDVYQKGKRKYAVLKSPNTYFPDKEDDYKFDKVDRSMSDDDIINDALMILRGIGKGLSVGITGKQMITQDPWKDSPPESRYYGFTYYYLNDGSQIHLEWLENSFSKGSKYDNATGYVEKSVTYFPYTKSHGIEGLPDDLRDQSDAATENFARSRYQGKDGRIGLNIDYSDRLKSVGTLKDSDIIKSLITTLQSQITSFDGTSESKLALCDPDTEYCKLIRYVDFNAEPKPTTTDRSASEDIPAGSTQSSDKTKLFLVGLPDKIEIKVGENLPDFSVHVNKIYTPPEDNINNGEIDEFNDLEELDEEYTEAAFVGEGETIVTFEEFKIEMAAALEDAKNAGDAVPIGNTIPIEDIKGVPKSTTTPSTSVIPPSFNSTPIYSQYDPRWGNSPFDWTSNGKKCGDNSTVASSGCGPSAVSMVINFWASKGYCNPVTPAIVAKFFSDFGGRVCGSGSGLGGVPKAKFKETFGIVLNSNATDAQIMSALKKGYPCVIAGRGYTGYNFKGVTLSNKYTGGHFVCLTGIDSEGRIRVNDSGNQPSGGKAITAFLPGKTIGDSMSSVSQRAILYPESMSSPVA